MDRRQQLSPRGVHDLGQPLGCSQRQRHLQCLRFLIDFQSNSQPNGIIKTTMMMPSGEVFVEGGRDPTIPLDLQEQQAVLLASFAEEYLGHLPFALLLPHQDAVAVDGLAVHAVLQQLDLASLSQPQQLNPLFLRLTAQSCQFSAEQRLHVLRGGKERSNCFAILLLEGLQHVGDCYLDLLLDLFPALLQHLLLAELHLPPALEHSLAELTLPLPPQVVHVGAAAVHLVVLPEPVEVRAVGEGEPAPAVVPAGGPLAAVDGAIGVVVCTVAVDAVVLPAALVELLHGCGLRVEGEEESSVAVLDLGALDYLPVALVQYSAQVLEPAVADQLEWLWLRLHFLYRLLHCIFGILFWPHLYNLILTHPSLRSTQCRRCSHTAGQGCSRSVKFDINGQWVISQFND